MTVARSLADAVWRLVLGAAMPWRMLVVLGVGGLIACVAAILLLRILLLPEYLLTTQFRHWRLRPLPGTHAFGRFIVWCTKAAWFLLCVCIASAILSVGSWFAQPWVTAWSPSIAAALSRYFDWWSSFGMYSAP